MTKVIYTLKLASKLIELGYQPITIMPNPKHPQFNCWVFKDTPEFEQALSEVLAHGE